MPSPLIPLLTGALGMGGGFASAGIQVGVFVDWNNNGVFGDVNEDVTLRLVSQGGIRSVRGADQLRSISPPMAGTFLCELINTTKDYTPDNGSSPLFGNLEAGRLVQFQFTDDAGVVRNQWTGILDSLEQHPAFGRKSVELPALGVLSRLRGKKISTGLFSNIRTDTAVNHILDAVNFSGNRNLDVGKTTLSWWWLDDEDAFEALLDLVVSEGPGANVFEGNGGGINFKNRSHRLVEAASATNQGTFDTVEEGEALVYDPGIRDVINICSFEVIERTLQASSVVWTLGATASFGPNETRKLQARSSGGDPFQGALFVAGTDYTVTIGSITSASLDRTSGSYCTITMTAGAAGATVTGIQLRAQLVTVTRRHNVQNTINTSASASQTKYGIRPFNPRLRPEVPLSFAQDFANALVSWYQSPRPILTLTLLGGTPAVRNQQLQRSIGHRITVVDDQLSLNATFYIDRIEHEVTLGPVLRTRFGCERTMAGTEYAVWGTGRWGTSAWGF